MGTDVISDSQTVGASVDATTPDERTGSSDQVTVASCRNYKHLENATKEEFEAIGKEYDLRIQNATQLTNTFFDMLLKQKEFGKLAQPIDLYEHGLQTATRCHRDGVTDVDILVMSLFHDVTESISCKGHGKSCAALLEPYLSPKATWMLANHEIFQGAYYFHHFGGDKNVREKLFKEHEWYQELCDWCQKYDAAAFDAEYVSETPEFFRPFCMEVFTREPYWWDKQHVMRQAVTGTAD